MPCRCRPNPPRILELVRALDVVDRYQQFGLAEAPLRSLQLQQETGEAPTAEDAAPIGG